MVDLPWWMETMARCRFGMWLNSFVRILRVKKLGGLDTDEETWEDTHKLTCRTCSLMIFFFFFVCVCVCVFLFLNECYIFINW